MSIPTEWDLTGKKAIVTADRRGWTPYFASALAEAGADVVVAGSQAYSDMAEATAAAASPKAEERLAIETDLTNAASVYEMAASAVNELGGVDILINNARAEFGRRFEQVSEDEWDRFMAFTVKSMFLTCQAVGGRMLEQGSGHIVNVGSGLSQRGLWNSVTACAAQGAIHQLTSSLALEWGRQGIRVNGIGAGWVTPEEQTEEDQKELLVRYLPSRRKGHPRRPFRAAGLSIVRRLRLRHRPDHLHRRRRIVTRLTQRSAFPTVGAGFKPVYSSVLLQPLL